MIGHVTSFGDIYANTVYGTDLTYGTDGDGNIILTGGTIKSVTQAFHDSDLAPVELLYTITKLPETDVATFNLSNPDWFDPEIFYALVPLFDSVNVKIYNIHPFDTSLGFAGDDNIKLLRQPGSGYESTFFFRR